MSVRSARDAEVPPSSLRRVRASASVGAHTNNWIARAIVQSVKRRLVLPFDCFSGIFITLFFFCGSYHEEHSTSTIISDTTVVEPLHDASGPYVSIELHDYEDLKSTKAQLDKASQEVKRRYEGLSRCCLDMSKCCLDNMDYVKAQVDQARQAEQLLFENFERVHNRLMF